MEVSYSEIRHLLQNHWNSLTNIPGALVFKKIEQDIDQDLIARIGELGPRGVPPRKFGSPERRMEWAEGRRCLLSLRDLLGEQGADLNKIRSSLSHSDDSVVAVACAPIEVEAKVAAEGESETLLNPLPLKVGVDLEPANRTFHHGVPERIMQAEEAKFDLEFLGFWVIKEACYKANPESRGTVMAHYFVDQFDAETRLGVAKCESHPQYDFRFKVVCDAGFWVAMAICTTSN